MNTPPFFLGACLLFWGWQTGWMIAAVPLAAILEGSRWHRLRWDFSDADIRRIWNICALLFIGAFILRLTSEDPTITGYAFVQWQPLICAPLMLLQAHSIRRELPLSNFSWLARWWGRKSREKSAAWNVAYLYAALCVGAAGAANQRDIYFFLGLCALAAWAAWDNRSPRFSAIAWVVTFLLAAKLGFQGQELLNQAQSFAEGRFANWFARWNRRNFDPIESRTSMGRIGALKQSGRIVMRVRPERGLFPSLLRQSAYDTLRDTVWYSVEHKFNHVLAEDDVTTWLLDTNQPAAGAASIFTQLPGKQGLLSAPNGSVRLENLPVGSLETNDLGVLRVKEAPGLLKYRVHYGVQSVIDEPPSANNLDLAVPERERNAVRQALAEININGPPTATLPAIAKYFQSHFRYELYVPENARSSPRMESPIARFLLKTHAGHCEYFASATVLMLRELGIPARYATGYAVSEKRRWSNTYLVRQRHAHAWVLAWINNAWQDFDTTPASWHEQEDEESSVFEPLDDAWSEVWFQLARWRWLGNRELFGRAAPWLIGPLIAILSWRIFTQRRRAGQKKNRAFEGGNPNAGVDSEFYQIEAKLAPMGLSRTPEESWDNWLRRVQAANGAVPNAELLPALVDLHCRYRFAREGLNGEEREHLRQSVRGWLEAVSQRS